MQKYSLIILLFLSFPITAQVRGNVYGGSAEKPEPLYNARIEVKQAGLQLRTDDEGYFEFVLPKLLPDTLVISATGYYADTIFLSKDDRFANFKIQLYNSSLLPEMVIEIRRDSKSISRLKTLLVETLDSDELKKAACCNLSESFETNASVDVSFTDAISGAKQIQMMGLSGVYTQIQMENIPYLRGLESAYGLNSIPGSWINSIQITKGSGSVVNGPESMAGLINLDLLHPDEMPKLFVNGYLNHLGRAEINTINKVVINPKLSTGFMLHGSALQQSIDNNRDGFKDLPTGSLISAQNRWKYVGEKMEAQWGINTYLDEKNGGQITFKNRQQTPNAYGLINRSEHVDVFAKTGFFFKKPGRSIGVLYNAKYQENRGLIGNHNYSGVEKRGFVNFIYDDYFGSTIHKIRTGFSGTAVEFDQQVDLISDDRTELIPGVFAEYTYTGLRWVIVSGLRTDYHNLFGLITSPRVHLKYLLSEKTDLRLSAGRGWRVPNYQQDYLSLLATGRQWIAPARVEAEISWNMGGSIVQEFQFIKRKATLVFDYFYTTFENQLVVDRDLSPDFIVFNYQKNLSYSHSFQVEWTYNLTKAITTRAAYKFLDVKSEYGGELQAKVMVPRHRGFLNIAFESRNRRWLIDQTTSVFGRSRLPVARLLDNSLTQMNESEVFPMLSAQITHRFKKIDVYLGGENLANYRMKDPILNASQPFSTEFDATRVWAPIMGTIVYGGFRLTIK